MNNVSVRFDYQMFWLADTADAWYRANGTTQVRPIDDRADHFAGSEIDVIVSWKAYKNLALTAGYSHFFTGDYLEATGTASDADFGFFMAVIDFEDCVMAGGRMTAWVGMTLSRPARGAIVV